eukprot:scaffold1244_cov162-Ochromonas_danica.AAC.8
MLYCTQSSVLFINQLRHKVGVLFGSPEVTSGGNALKFYSSVRLDIRRKEVIKDTTVKGMVVRVKVVKNKIAPPFRSVDLELSLGRGIDQHVCLLDAAEQVGAVERKGAWYSKGELRLGQGKRAAADYLRDNTDFAASLEEEVRLICAKNKHHYSAIAEVPTLELPQGQSAPGLSQSFLEQTQEMDFTD